MLLQVCRRNSTFREGVPRSYSEANKGQFKGGAGYSEATFTAQPMLQYLKFDCA